MDSKRGPSENSKRNGDEISDRRKSLRKTTKEKSKRSKASTSKLSDTEAVDENVGESPLASVEDFGHELEPQTTVTKQAAYENLLHLGLMHEVAVQTAQVCYYLEDEPADIDASENIVQSGLRPDVARSRMHTNVTASSNAKGFQKLFSFSPLPGRCSTPWYQSPDQHPANGHESPEQHSTRGYQFLQRHSTHMYQLPDRQSTRWHHPDHHFSPSAHHGCSSCSRNHCHRQCCNHCSYSCNSVNYNS